MSAVAGSSARWCAGSRRCPDPDPCCPPWRGGGRQPCTGLRVVLPPVRKSPVNRTICTCCRGAHVCRKDCGHGGGAGRAQMHGADAPAYMLLMSVACVTARPSAVLDVCVLLPRCCASVAVVMSSAVRCVSMRLVLSPRAVMVTARLLAGAARQRTASRGAQSAE